MNCKDAQHRLQVWHADGEALDHDVQAHIAACELCHRRYADLLLERTLGKHIVPMREGFVDQAIAAAVARHEPSRHFGWEKLTALAASVAALALLIAVFGTTPGEGTGGAGEGIVNVAPDRQQTVQVVIDSRGAQERAVITLALADNLELEGYPQHRMIEWETALLAGKNLLALPFEVLDGDESYFDLSLSYGDRQETIRVPVRSAARAAGNTTLST